MKTLIIGTGVIYGWTLRKAGLDLTHLVRPGKTGPVPNSPRRGSFLVHI